jgi:phosphoribosylformylglycinamidine synthase
VDLVHVRRLIAEPTRLEAAELAVFPGGFSYGDDIAAGRVLGYEVRHHLSQPFAAFVARGGYVLGVCNGFQVLVDTGLLEPPRQPGAAGPGAQRRRFALAPNTSARFECRWVTLRAERSAVSWLEPGTLMPVPVAHGEGRFVPADDAALEALRSAGQLALRYVAPDGGPAAYPDNPNGSADDVAGVCDPSGRVLGLMPHPERNITPWHHPRWTRLGPRAEGEGLAFYRGLVHAASGAPV